MSSIERLFHTNLPFIAFLFVIAVGLRVYGVSEPPLNFHTTRQYRSLLIARGHYYEHSSAIPEWKKQVARIDMERQGILEPPVMELLVATGYNLAGREHFGIPKLLSTLFWLIGGGFLYRIAVRLAGGKAGLFSLAFYLFLPFAVVASRSFQPDPLMVMLLLASILSMLKYHDEPTRGRLVFLTVLSALAIFIKPISLFVICVAFISLALQRHSLRDSLFNRSLLLYFPVILLPALLFYIIYGIFIVGDLQTQAQASFLPRLLLDPFFWRGWLHNVRLVVGFPALVGALVGVLMFPNGQARNLLVGLWFGYVLFCLSFSYHIASHDYYHLQLVPIVALSLGPIAALIIERLPDANQTWYWRLAIWPIVLLALLLSLIESRSLLLNPGFERKVRTAEEIGTLVDHSTNTIYLASDYGASLEYHGLLAGRPWPLVSDLEWEQLAGLEILDAETRFHDWFAWESPQYFIVIDQWEFEQQTDLNKFLQDFPVVALNDNYIIFDLQPAQ